MILLPSTYHGHYNANSYSFYSKCVRFKWCTTITDTTAIRRWKVGEHFSENESPWTVWLSQYGNMLTIRQHFEAWIWTIKEKNWKEKKERARETEKQCTIQCKSECILLEAYDAMEDRYYQQSTKTSPKHCHRIDYIF